MPKNISAPPPSAVKQVSEQMKPGSSAIFFIVGGDDPNLTVADLREYNGKLPQTTQLGEKIHNQLFSW